MRDAVGRRKDKDEQILTAAASEKLKAESWGLAVSESVFTL